VDVDESGYSLKKKLEQETDLYKILQVPRYASQEEIKRKYHHLAKIHHPDSGGDGEIFMHIQSAYAVLGDVDKRSAYNEEKREKETERIKADASTPEKLRYDKLSVLQANVSVSHTKPDLSEHKLVIGMRNPIPGPPVHVLALPVLILGNVWLAYAALYGGYFDDIISQMVEYANTKTVGWVDFRQYKIRMMTMPVMTSIVLGIVWIQMHSYLNVLRRQLIYPDFVVYSAYYNESSDEVVFICGNHDKLNMFRPKQLFITIKNASKFDLEPGLDRLDFGFGGRSKSISFDVPIGEHSFGIQKWRAKFFETIVSDRSALEKHKLEKVIEQLRANHIVCHIPHFLQLNREHEMPKNVPLFKYIDQKEFLRVTTTFGRFLGYEKYESPSNPAHYNTTFEN